MNTLKFTLVIIAAFIARSGFAQAGALDPTFGIGGIVITTFNTDLVNSSAMVLQADGKIIVAGISYKTGDGDFALARYTIDGILDNTFGTGGKVTIPIGTGVDGATSVAIQTGGKIVVAGSSTSGLNNTDFALIRLNTDGTLDSTFGTKGKVVTAVSSSNDYIYAMALQADGKIVVTGISYNGTTSSSIAVARYTADGALDNTFGTGGKLTTAIGTSFDVAYAMAIQADSKIVAAGQTQTGTNFHFALVRYNTDGSLDNTFGTGGKVTNMISSTFDGVYALKIDANGKIIAGGQARNATNFDFALARFNTDGTLDNTFGTSGKVISPMNIGGDDIFSMVLQPDGKIVVTGSVDSTNNGVQSEFGIARFTTLGILDNSFGKSGKTIVPIGTNSSMPRAIAMQTDGKFVVTGGTTLSGTNIALARFNGDPAIGITRFSLHEDLALVYPNPVYRDAMLEYTLVKDEMTSIHLYDMQGKLVLSFIENEMQAVGKHQQKIVVEDLPSGIYMLAIESSSGNVMMKLVK